jgi:REP element-mobilizing transposase RayT
MIQNGEMQRNAFGEIANDEWLNVPKRYPNVSTDAFVVMPDHIHGIIVVASPVGAPLVGALSHPGGRAHSTPIGNIIGAYKSLVATRILQLCKTNGVKIKPVWQRNYHERIIRGDCDLVWFREYIRQNPIRWEEEHCGNF